MSLKLKGRNVSLIIPAEQNFEANGISVVAVRLPRAGWEQLVLCPWLIFRKALTFPSNSIFHLHDSELLVAGLALRLLGRRIIYDAHEDTPLQISYQHWIPWYLKPLYQLIYRVLEKLAGWCFNHIIVAEPVIAKYFPANKTTLLRNFPIAANFSQFPAYAGRDHTLVYIGLLSKPRGVLEMLEGHRIANKKTPVRFVLGGKFAPASLKAECLDKYQVDFRDWLSYNEMIKVLNLSTIGIIVPHPIERYRTNYPVKLFEYMAAGLPVIASAEGESSLFVKEANAGLLVDPTNVEDIANAISRLTLDAVGAEAMGARGRKLIQEKYNWEKESEKLISLYESLG